MTYAFLIGAAAVMVFGIPEGLPVLAAVLLGLAVWASIPRPLVYGLADRPLRLRRVIDGDTFEVEAPPGAPTHLGGAVAVRLRGCDAVELGEPGGPEARRLLRRFLRRGRILCSNVGREKYGRALATVTVSGADAARYLIEEGAAVPYDGGAR